MKVKKRERLFFKNQRLFLVDGIIMLVKVPFFVYE